MIPLNRFATSRLRLLLVVVLGSVVSGGAWRLYGEYRRPLRAAASEFLSMRRVLRHVDEIEFAARESGVDPYLLAGIMVAESSGRVDAVSNRGALGLFQLTPTTAEWRAEIMGLPKPTREQLLSDPLLNARLGANNMAWLLDTFDGDTVRALCAYNAGARKLKQLADAAGGWEAWREAGEESGRSQILAYAKKVLRIADEYRERGVFEEESAVAAEETVRRTDAN